MLLAAGPNRDYSRGRSPVLSWLSAPESSPPVCFQKRRGALVHGGQQGTNAWDAVCRYPRKNGSVLLQVPSCQWLVCKHSAPRLCTKQSWFSVALVLLWYPQTHQMSRTHRHGAPKENIHIVQMSWTCRYLAVYSVTAEKKKCRLAQTTWSIVQSFLFPEVKFAHGSLVPPPPPQLNGRRPERVGLIRRSPPPLHASNTRSPTGQTRVLPWSNHFNWIALDAQENIFISPNNYLLIQDKYDGLGLLYRPASQYHASSTVRWDCFISFIRPLSVRYSSVNTCVKCCVRYQGAVRNAVAATSTIFCAITAVQPWEVCVCECV